MDGKIDGKFTIAKGQGISQGIATELGLTKEQCKKLGLSVWTEILKEVDKQKEINENLYSGGNDINGSYQENYIVRLGQEISLIDVWDNILKLINDKLGTDFKVDEAEKPHDDETVNHDEDNNDNNNNDETVEPENKPKDIETDRPKRTPKTAAKLEEAVPEKAGKTYKNSDDSTTTYDKNGYISSTTDAQGRTVVVVNRNDIKYMEDFIQYKYNEKGQVSRTITRDNRGFVIGFKDYKYDKKGNNTRIIHRTPDGYLAAYYDYEYNSKNRKIKTTIRGEDHQVLGYEEYEYSRSGRLQKIYYKDENGTVTMIRTYHKDGSETLTRPDGKPLS